MNELAANMKDNGLTGVKLKRPMDASQMGHEALALTALCGFLNNPAVTGAEVPPGELASTKVTTKQMQEIHDKSGATVPPADPLTAHRAPIAVMPPQPAPPVAKAPADFSRVFYTGRIGVGKDHVAAATGAKIFGFADPLYYLVKHFFGVDVTATANKNLPGVRACLQTFGQWGRGEMTEQYPLTAARACFVTMIRSLAGADILDSSFGVDWAAYGSDKNVWLNACVARVNAYRIENPGARVAITNVRFENEFKALQEQGWIHFHVMCSPAVWKDRLAKRGLAIDSPALKDLSERLAAFLDQDVTKKISGSKGGHRLHAIWNDDTKCPSNRLYTLNQVLQEAAIADATPVTEEFNIHTGE